MLKKNNIIIAVVLLIIAGFYIYTIIASNTQAPVETPHTVSYTDPANHYTIAIPSNWSTTTTTPTQRLGIGTSHEETIHMETTNLALDNMGVTILVSGKAPVCENTPKPNTTFAGFPAYFDPHHYSYTINTTTDTMRVSYYYPGAGVFHRRIQPTPPTKAEMEQNKKTMDTILATLKLTNKTPLSCP